MFGTTKNVRWVIFMVIAEVLSACGTSSVSSNSTGTTDSQTVNTSASVCNASNNFDNVPTAFIDALSKYTTVNSQYLINVCTEDNDGDGNADYVVVESTNLPEHESVYFEAGHQHHEEYDFETNIHKFGAAYDGSQVAHSAGSNMIQQQAIIMKMPISPQAATTKTATTFSSIGLALNGVSFFNENAAPGDQITDELFTFDQCSGHPQQAGIYHYHVDPVCLIRDLGGSVSNHQITSSGTTYSWIEDDGSNAGLLMGFLSDGFPVYGPIGVGEIDCNNTAVPAIDNYNGHSHCTDDFTSAIYHYHVKTANLGATGNPVFWITNEFYYGMPGEISNN